MEDQPTPTVRHRRLSSELKRLRENAGLPVQDVAERMGWDQTKIYRIERGQWKRLNPQDVRALTECYGVEDDHYRDALVEMAKQSKVRGWWVRYADVLGEGAYVAMEAEASEIRTFEASVVPGLLQTAEYAEATARSVGSTDRAQTERQVEARQARQSRLTSDAPLKFSGLVDEAALWKSVGERGLMARQLQHLSRMNELPNVELRVVPNVAGVHQGAAGAFVLIEFPFVGEPTAVFLEHAHDDLFLEDKEDIERYSHIYDSLSALSLSVERSNDLMDKIARSHLGEK